MPSAWASRQPCTGPEPPKATNVRSRGSRPRSIETTRVASSMLVVTIAWIPHAASSSDRPSGAATFVSIARVARSEEHTSELQSRLHLVCRLLLEKKKNKDTREQNTQ